jgi:hypothetical protein
MIFDYKYYIKNGKWITMVVNIAIKLDVLALENISVLVATKHTIAQKSVKKIVGNFINLNVK